MLEVDEDSRLGRELMPEAPATTPTLSPTMTRLRDFYQQACEMLAAAGVAQYEISNFARVTPELQDSEYKVTSRAILEILDAPALLGFGVDAHSMLQLVEGRASAPVRVRTAACGVGIAALGCPSERSSATVGGHDDLDRNSR